MNNDDLSFLTIITPSLNSAETIRWTLESVRPLVKCGAEHIVVDSYSIDETVAIVEATGARVISHPPGNMYAAINAGIQASNRDWITYINSDDILYSDPIILTLKKYSNSSDVIYGNIDYIDSSGRFLHHWHSNKVKDIGPLFANHIMPIPQQGTLFKKSVWNSLNGFNEDYKYSSDFDFFLRSFMKGYTFVYDNSSTLAAFRVHESQISQKFVEIMNKEVDRSVKKSGIIVARSRFYHSLIRMRSRNIISYIVRLFRNYQLNHTWRVTKTLELNKKNLM